MLGGVNSVKVYAFGTPAAARVQNRLHQVHYVQNMAHVEGLLLSDLGENDLRDPFEIGSNRLVASGFTTWVRSDQARLYSRALGVVRLDDRVFE